MKALSEHQVKWWYGRINRLAWKGRLPPLKIFNRCPHSGVYKLSCRELAHNDITCYIRLKNGRIYITKLDRSEICFNWKFIGDMSEFLLTLVHEMVHLAGLEDCGNKKFGTVVFRILKKCNLLDLL